MSSSFEVDPAGIYRCTAFEQFTWLEHGFGSRAANPKAEVTLRQIHSNHVLNAAGLHDRERDGDALVSNEVGTAVGVRTADCVPILLLDRRRRTVAAVHAGWRGTVAEIIKAATEKLASDFESDPADLLAAIGPCIRRCCYRVGPEVAQRFSSYFPEGKLSDPNPALDLAEVNRRQMLNSGFSADQIFDCGFCTNCEVERFFSYRREPDNPGRMISAIARTA